MEHEEEIQRLKQSHKDKLKYIKSSLASMGFLDRLNFLIFGEKDRKNLIARYFNNE